MAALLPLFGAIRVSKKQTIIHHLHNNKLFFKDNLIQIAAKIEYSPIKRR